MIKKITSFFLSVSLVFVTSGIFSPLTVSAGSLTGLSDTVSNLTAGALANHTILFTTPTGIAAGATLVLTFDNGTDVGSISFGDIELFDDGVAVTLAGAPSGSTWGVVKTSSTVITFTNGSSAVAAGSNILIKIGTNATGGVNQITNGSAGTTVLRLSGTFGDTGALSMAILSNGVVSVSAEVLGSITFTVSDNAIYFGNLKTNGVCFATDTNPGAVTCPQTTEAEAFNITAGTNASTGYTVSVQGPTLTSGLNTITAIGGSNTASSPGSEQFGLRIDVTGSGSGTVSAPYAASGYAYAADANTPSTIATASGASDINTYSVRYMANISALTEAGSYVAAHSYVATGNF